jgi:hypothetical protein
MALWEGYSDYLVAPDEAIATFYGNGYASAMQVIQMTASAVSQSLVECVV